MALLASPAPATALGVAPGDLFLLLHLGAGGAEVYHLNPDTGVETLVATAGHLTAVGSQREITVAPDGFVYVWQSRDTSSTPGSEKLVRIDPSVDFDAGDPLANQELLIQGGTVQSLDDTAAVPTTAPVQVAALPVWMAGLAALAIAFAARLRRQVYPPASSV